MKHSEEHREFSYGIKIIKHAFFLWLLEIGFFFVIRENILHNIYGLLLGGVVNILFFRLMYLNINKVLDGKVKNVQAYIFINYFARYAITGCILYIAAVQENISLYSCFLGLLSIKIVIYLQNFYSMYLKRER